MFKFLTYNNAVPIGFSIILLGAGGAFAATNPDAIYSSESQVVSIDNSYISNKDLTAYSPHVEITGVTEDDDTYYVAYNFYTIDLKDGVWQDVIKGEVMNVSKADLGKYRDLGLYVTEQLKQKTERELAYLTEVQGIERKNVTHKVVATQYGGLVGKLLDTKTEELPGYTPVVTPPPAPVIAAAQNSPSQPESQNQSVAPGNPSLSIQVLGNNPAQIAQRTSYADLGVVASDDHNSNIRIETYLDSVKVSIIQIDTTATSTHKVRYVALDPAGNSVAAERTVIVYDPAVGPPVPASQVQNGSGSAPATGTSSANSGSAATTNTSGSSQANSSAGTSQAQATSSASTATSTDSSAGVTATSTASATSTSTAESSAATTTSSQATSTTPADTATSSQSSAASAGAATSTSAASTTPALQ